MGDASFRHPLVGTGAADFREGMLFQWFCEIPIDKKVKFHIIIQLNSETSHRSGNEFHRKMAAAFVGNFYWIH